MKNGWICWPINFPSIRSRFLAAVIRNCLLANRKKTTEKRINIKCNFKSWHSVLSQSASVHFPLTEQFIYDSSSWTNFTVTLCCWFEFSVCVRMRLHFLFGWNFRFRFSPTLRQIHCCPSHINIVCLSGLFILCLPTLPTNTLKPNKPTILYK